MLDYTRIFCQNLKMLREKHSLTKKEMADILEIGTRTLDKIERGALPKAVTVKIIFQVQRHLGVPAKELFAPLNEKEDSSL